MKITSEALAAVEELDQAVATINKKQNEIREASEYMAPIAFDFFKKVREAKIRTLRARVAELTKQLRDMCAA